MENQMQGNCGVAYGRGVPEVRSSKQLPLKILKPTLGHSPYSKNYHEV